MITCRMFGYSSKKHLPIKMPEEISALYEKYNKRYHIDRVLNELELKWFLHKYSKNIRGIYIGNAKNINLQELVLKAETRKKKNRVAKIKQEKEIAREKALQHLGLKQQRHHEQQDYCMNTAEVQQLK